MPRPRVRYKARDGLPPGVRDSVTALAMDGTTPTRVIAARYGVDVQTVRRLAEQVEGLDPAHVALIKRTLPDLQAILAAEHTLEAIKRAHKDPATSVKSTFGAKLAIEAARLSTPDADKPGRAVLTFMQRLRVSVPLSSGNADPGVAPVVCPPARDHELDDGAASLHVLPPSNCVPVAVADNARVVGQDIVQHDGK